MNLFQFLLFILGILLLFVSKKLYNYKKITRNFLFILVFVSFIIIIVGLFPDITVFFAKIFGISRGADAVVYGSIIFLLFLILKVNIKMIELEQKITKLVRNLALSNYHEQPKNKKKKD